MAAISICLVAVKYKCSDYPNTARKESDTVGKEVVASTVRSLVQCSMCLIAIESDFSKAHDTEHTIAIHAMYIVHCIVKRRSIHACIYIYIGGVIMSAYVYVHI